jgi:hypothetical protein
MGTMCKTLLLTIVAMLMVTSLMAQSVLKDRNGTPIPYVGTSWQTQTVACSADTVWTKVTIPAGVYELNVRPTASIKIAADSLYAASNNYEATLQDTLTYVTLPAHNMKTMWIRRASAGTAANLNIIYRKW